MKKLCLFVLSLLFLFTGCSDDDNVPGNHPILGEWMLAEYYVNIETDEPELTWKLREMIDREVGQILTIGTEAVFHKNGRLVLVDTDGEKENRSFSIRGSEVTISDKDEDAVFGFEIDGQKLYIYEDIMKICKKYALMNGYNDITIQYAETGIVFNRL